VLPLNGIQIHDTKRKIVFPNIKNKFRFVTVSLLLASLVTVISSASATPAPDDLSKDLGFSLDVAACENRGAEWEPAFTEYKINTSEGVPWIGDVPISTRQGDTVEITVALNWDPGTNDCGESFGVAQTGTYDAAFVFPLTYTVSSSTSTVGGLTVETFDSNSFDLPADTPEGIGLVRYQLTWTPAT
jgi:hypothetical protein